MDPTKVSQSFICSESAVMGVSELWSSSERHKADCMVNNKKAAAGTMHGNAPCCAHAYSGFPRVGGAVCMLCSMCRQAARRLCYLGAASACSSLLSVAALASASIASSRLSVTCPLFQIEP